MKKEDITNKSKGNAPGPSLGLEDVLRQPKENVQEYPTRFEVVQENQPNVPYESTENMYSQNINYGSTERKEPERKAPERKQPERIEHIIVQEPEVREVVIVERPVYFGYPDPYPVVPKATAWFLLLINLFLPGVGTMIIACLGGDPGYFILSGLLQMITVIFIIGYIMAIWTSAILIIKAE